MIKTQIQLPDALYRALKRVAKEREMSMAEVMRRGAEYITHVYLPMEKEPSGTGLPGPFHVGVKVDPFANPDWRYELNERTAALGLVRESRGPGYKTHAKKKK